MVLRDALVAGKSHFPHLADHLSTYLAQTLFHTSDFALTGKKRFERVFCCCDFGCFSFALWSLAIAAEKQKLVLQFAGNTEMCQLTEQGMVY